MSNTRGKRRLRESMNTIRYHLPLPDMNHPIWTMGYEHVAIAYAVCCGFAVLNPEFCEDQSKEQRI